MKAHGAQKRASGDPYFSHPLEVAAILTDLKLDDATIVAALLHDTIEDTEATRAEIDQMFGPEIGALVEGLTKLKRLDLVSREAKQAENLRKLLLAIADDVRVLLVKLADRLHNMRTLRFHAAGQAPPHRRGDARHLCAARRPHGHAGDARGTRGPVVPHARSGSLCGGDAAARCAGRAQPQPDRRDRKPAVARISQKNGIDRAVSTAGASSRFRSGRKMERKSVGFEQLSDIFGFRVVRRHDVEACYRALGVVHTTWPVVPGRFKDYISTPKQNDYRSIHTTVIGPGNQRVELQIRTEEMDQIAEFGIAAHALLQGRRRLADRAAASANPTPLPGCATPSSILSESANPEEFLEHTKLELFHDQVFCFTPKGKLIALPRQANVDRLRLCGAYRRRQQRGRLQDQRQVRAAVVRTAERRRGRGPDLEGAGRAAVGLGIARGHRQGAGGDPARDPHRGARSICRPRPPHRRARCSRAPRSNTPTTS